MPPCHRFHSTSTRSTSHSSKLNAKHKIPGPLHMPRHTMQMIYGSKTNNYDKMTCKKNKTNEALLLSPHTHAQINCPQVPSSNNANAI